MGKKRREVDGSWDWQTWVAGGLVVAGLAVLAFYGGTYLGTVLGGSGSPGAATMESGAAGDRGGQTELGSAGPVVRVGEDAVVEFRNVERQTRRFIAANQTIELTPAQESVRRAALNAIPAPCCDNFSAYTCCCECNMAQSIWGLSKTLIARHGFDAEQVRDAAKKWIHFINPAGFSGDVCFSAGGCARAFADNGCGGMRPSDLTTG